MKGLLKHPRVKVLMKEYQSYRYKQSHKKHLRVTPRMKGHPNQTKSHKKPPNETHPRIQQFIRMNRLLLEKRIRERVFQTKPQNNNDQNTSKETQSWDSKRKFWENEERRRAGNCLVGAARIGYNILSTDKILEVVNACLSTKLKCSGSRKSAGLGQITTEKMEL